MKISNLLAWCSLSFLVILVITHKKQPHQQFQKAIVVGATSGIGRALAKELVVRGYQVGITGRRKALLEALAQELGSKTIPQVMDVTHPERAHDDLQKLIQKMGGLDLIVLNAGVGTDSLSWQEQKKVIETNIIGFAALATTAFTYFAEQNKGHLVGISSIAGLRGFASAPVYSASKAFISCYLEGLRARAYALHKNITITDIKPGFVDTPMGQGSAFWRATPEKAAQQIADALEKKKPQVYVTKRWGIVALLLKIAPEGILKRIPLTLFPTQSQIERHEGMLEEKLPEFSALL